MDNLMSRKQWKLLDVMQRVKDGQLTNQEAALALGLSERQTRRLRHAVKEKGEEALTHGNRGRPPSNRVAEELRQRILELARGRYAGFNDHHITEKLNEIEGIKVSRATLQRMLRGGGLASPRKRRGRKHHRRRERKAQEGLMLLWDGSSHDWLEGRGPRLCLMGAVDDATGALMPGAHFVEHECSVGYLGVLLAICDHKGAPMAIYMDRHSSLKRNDEHWTVEEELRGEQDKTQVGRALAELAINPIFALSPQAKGRVERLWGTLQDRLVSEMRLAGVSDIRAANEFMLHFTPDFNQRFARPAQDVTAAWRPVSKQQGSRACALSYKLKIGNDNTVRFQGHIIDVRPGPGGRSYAGGYADLRYLLDGSVQLYQGDTLLETTSQPLPPPTRTARRRKQEAARPEPKQVKKALTFKQIAAKNRPVQQESAGPA